MANKKAILLVHGMGNHTAPVETGSNKSRGSFGKEFIDTCNLALKKYPSHESDSIETHLDIHEFNYNAWFDIVRQKMAERNKSVNERVNAIGNHYGVTFASELVGKLASLENKYDSDGFFYTHWLDVIFYATILGGKVRVDAGKKIAYLVKTYGPSNVHIFAHSLGTAVMHDTLALLYRPESDPNDEIPDLNITDHKLGTVWMVANVSRLLHAANGIADPLRSTVKPGNEGCANVFNNVRHKLDPFTWISRFSPQNNGKWVPEPIYDAFYTDTVTSLVTKPNPHDVTQYLEDPLVAEKLFLQLIKFKFTTADLEAARDDYRKKSIQGAYALLEQEFSDLEIRDFESWKDFLDAGINLNKAIKLITEALP